MLFAVTGDEYPDKENLDRLHTVLKGKLRSKRFLLVLDDARMKTGAKGRAEAQEFWMKWGWLSRCFFLFYQIKAFWSFSSSVRLLLKILRVSSSGEDLEENIWEIEGLASGCWDCVKTQNWRRSFGKYFGDRNMEIRARMSDHVSVLKKSYRHVQGHLNSCFSFCTLFPKDYVLDKLSLGQCVWQMTLSYSKRTAL